MKYYTKLLEKGCNKYYVTVLGDSVCLASESFVPCKTRFGRTKKVTQTFKFLELTPQLELLFNRLMQIEVDVENNTHPDMTKYKIPTEVEVIKYIKGFYHIAIEEELEKLKTSYKELSSNVTEEEKVELKKQYNEYKIRLESNIIPSNIIFDKHIIGKECPIIKEFYKQGYKFLYAEQLTTLYKQAFLYEIDVFGTLTIYRIDIVKGKIKKIDTIILNMEILQKYYEWVLNK